MKNPKPQCVVFLFEKYTLQGTNISHFWTQGKSSSKLQLQGICLCRERSNILCGMPIPQRKTMIMKKTSAKAHEIFLYDFGPSSSLGSAGSYSGRVLQYKNASRILIQYSVKSCQIQLVGHWLQAITRAVLAKAVFWIRLSVARILRKECWDCMKVKDMNSLSRLSEFHRCIVDSQWILLVFLEDLECSTLAELLSWKLTSRSEVLRFWLLS